MASPEAVADLLFATADVVKGVMRGISPGTPESTVQRAVEKSVSDHFYRETRNRPEIIVQVIPAV